MPVWAIHFGAAVGRPTRFAAIPGAASLKKTRFGPPVGRRPHRWRLTVLKWIAPLPDMRYLVSPITRSGAERQCGGRRSRRMEEELNWIFRGRAYRSPSRSMASGCADSLPTVGRRPQRTPYPGGTSLGKYTLPVQLRLTERGIWNHDRSSLAGSQLGTVAIRRGVHWS